MARKTIALFFAMLILNAGTEFHQLLKIPLLVDHYKDHCKLDSSVSFIDFINLHYGAGQHPPDNDEGEDNELPFNSPGSINHLDISIIVRIIPTAIPILQKNTQSSYYSEPFLAKHSFTIFHPPRLA